MSRPAAERFWEKVDKSGPDGCWAWTSHKDRKGYGLFSIPPSRTVRAHRFSYSQHFGTDPSGLFVCHRCDNPGCVNPEHLWLGTPADNSRDMVAKGRARTTPRLGEKHHQAKLTESEVIAIRELRKNLGTKALAQRFNVSETQIRYIVRRSSWRHLP